MMYKEYSRTSISETAVYNCALFLDRMIPVWWVGFFPSRNAWISKITSENKHLYYMKHWREVYHNTRMADWGCVWLSLRTDWDWLCAPGVGSADEPPAGGGAGALHRLRRHRHLPHLPRSRRRGTGTVIIHSGIMHRLTHHWLGRGRECSQSRIYKKRNNDGAQTHRF